MSTEYTLAELFAAFSNLAETNTKLLRQYDESAARIAVAGPMLIDLFGYDVRHNTQRAFSSFLMRRAVSAVVALRV